MRSRTRFGIFSHVPLNVIKAGASITFSRPRNWPRGAQPSKLIWPPVALPHPPTTLLCGQISSRNNDRTAYEDLECRHSMLGGRYEETARNHVSDTGDIRSIGFCSERNRRQCLESHHGKGR